MTRKRLKYWVARELRAARAVVCPFSSSVSGDRRAPGGLSASFGPSAVAAPALSRLFLAGLIVIRHVLAQSQRALFLANAARAAVSRRALVRASRACGHQSGEPRAACVSRTVRGHKRRACQSISAFAKAPNRPQSAALAASTKDVARGSVPRATTSSAGLSAWRAKHLRAGSHAILNVSRGSPLIGFSEAR